MGRWIDYTGEKIGSITIISYVGGSFWDCACDCGEKVILQSRSFARKNAGDGCCDNCPYRKIIWKKNRAGEKFGCLTAIKKTRSDLKNKNTYWLYRCDCGRDVVLSSSVVSKKRKWCTPDCQLKIDFYQEQRGRGFVDFCRVCGGQRELKRDALCRKCAAERNKQYDKKQYPGYRENYIKQNRRIVDGLKDGYVIKKILREKTSKQLELTSKDITPGMIELKREQLKLNRLIREVKNGIN